MKFVTLTALTLSIACVLLAAAPGMRSNRRSLDCGVFGLAMTGSDIFVASSLERLSDRRRPGGPRPWFETSHGAWQLGFSLVDAALVFGGVAFLLTGRLLAPRFRGDPNACPGRPACEPQQE